MAERPSPADLAAILQVIDAESVTWDSKSVAMCRGEVLAMLAAEVRTLQQELRAAKEGAAHLAQRQIMDEAWGGGIRDVDDSLRDNPPAEAKYFCRVCPECGCALQDKYHAPDCYYHCPCGIDSLSGTQPERWVTAEGKPLHEHPFPTLEETDGEWTDTLRLRYAHPFPLPEEGTATC